MKYRIIRRLIDNEPNFVVQVKKWMVIWVDYKLLIAEKDEEGVFGNFVTSCYAKNMALIDMFAKTWFNNPEYKYKNFTIAPIYYEDTITEPHWYVKEMAVKEIKDEGFISMITNTREEYEKLIDESLALIEKAEDYESKHRKDVIMKTEKLEEEE